MVDELDKFIVDEVKKQVNIVYKKKYLELCKEKNLIPRERIRNKLKKEMMDYFDIKYIDKGFWGDGFIAGLDYAIRNIKLINKKK